MNIEVEIKVRVDGLGEIRKKLPKFGKLIKNIRQIDEYYIPFHRDFFAHKPCPVEWLRIRTDPDKVVFEYDKSVDQEDGSQDYADEYETEISQPDEFRKILKFLDFNKVITVDKQREYWNCGDIEVCLDEVKDLGYFIEAEAKGDFKDTKETRKKCIKFLEGLNLKCKGNLIKTGYPVLFLEKNKMLKKTKKAK